MLRNGLGFPHWLPGGQPAKTDGILDRSRTPHGDFQSRFVVNAAGLYADALHDWLACGYFTIQPRKGEEYLLDKRLKGL